MLPNSTYRVSHGRWSELTVEWWKEDTHYMYRPFNLPDDIQTVYTLASVAGRVHGDGVVWFATDENGDLKEFRNGL